VAKASSQLSEKNHWGTITTLLLKNDHQYVSLYPEAGHEIPNDNFITKNVK
jgi:hypothetical protein